MPACQRVPRGPKRGEGLRTGDTVRLQRRPLLEAVQGRVDPGTEDPVEVTRGEAVLGEPELERRDVPALVPELEAARTEPVAREAAESLAGLRADHAVDRDVGLFLEAANRLRRARPGEPVDRALIKPMRAQADLKGGDARIGRRGAGGDGRGGEDQGQSKERPGTHGMTVFAVSVGNP
jgi:hypothetical protein